MQQLKKNTGKYDFAKTINKILSEKNITQYRLSKMTGIAQPTINILLTGKRRFTLNYLELIAHSLNIDVSILILDSIVMTEINNDIKKQKLLNDMRLIIEELNTLIYNDNNSTKKKRTPPVNSTQHKLTYV